MITEEVDILLNNLINVMNRWNKRHKKVTGKLYDEIEKKIVIAKKKQETKVSDLLDFAMWCLSVMSIVGVNIGPDIDGKKVIFIPDYLDYKSTIEVLMACKDALMFNTPIVGE